MIKTKITLDDWQRQFLQTKGDKILCCGRQVGKSETCSLDAGEYAVTHKNKTILMIAPTERQAHGLFEKTLDYLAEHYPKLIKQGKERPTKTRIFLKNGTKIYCLPTGLSGLGIRFLTVDRLYADEASRIPEAVWAAVTPMLLTTGGDTIMLSTPFGVGTEFHRTFINHDNAYNSFTRFSVSSEEVIAKRKICKTWSEKQRDKALERIHREKKRMSDREFAEEYLGQFVEDLFRWFPDELIESVCTLKRRNPPISKAGRHYIGCDIARMGEDEGTIEILDKISKEKIHHVENIITKKQLTTETELRIAIETQRWNAKKVYIDAGAGTLGVSVLDHLLIDRRTRNKVVAINNAKRVLDRWDESRTKLQKEDLYNNLKSLMEKGILKLLDDESVIESLRSIRYEYTKKEGERTKLRIYGSYSHVTEGLIRAAWCYKDKTQRAYIDFV